MSMVAGEASPCQRDVHVEALWFGNIRSLSSSQSQQKRRVPERHPENATVLQLARNAEAQAYAEDAVSKA